MFLSEGWIKWTCPVWDGSLLIEFPPDCSSPKSSTNYFNVSLWSFWPLAAGSSTSGPQFCGWFNTHLFLTFNCNLCRLKTSAVFTLLCPAVIRHVWAQEILIINYIRWLFKIFHSYLTYGVNYTTNCWELHYTIHIFDYSYLTWHYIVQRLVFLVTQCNMEMRRTKVSESRAEKSQRIICLKNDGCTDTLHVHNVLLHQQARFLHSCTANIHTSLEGNATCQTVKSISK